jgi:hypothetical protein
VGAALSQKVNCEVARLHASVSLLFREKPDDRLPVVLAAGTAYLMKLRVEQLFKALPRTPDSGVMEFDLE